MLNIIVVCKAYFRKHPWGIPSDGTIIAGLARMLEVGCTDCGKVNDPPKHEVVLCSDRRAASAGRRSLASRFPAGGTVPT